MLDIYSGLGDKMKIVIRGHPTTTLIQPNYNTLLLIMYTYLHTYLQFYIYIYTFFIVGIVM